jgi:hypothetical protein
LRALGSLNDLGMRGIAADPNAPHFPGTAGGVRVVASAFGLEGHAPPKTYILRQAHISIGGR